MPIKTGLMTGLNQIRELASPLYQTYIPIIDENTSIEAFGQPLFERPTILNEFTDALVDRIVSSQLDTIELTNPLRDLEGQLMPLRNDKSGNLCKSGKR